MRRMTLGLRITKYAMLGFAVVCLTALSLDVLKLFARPELELAIGGYAAIGFALSTAAYVIIQSYLSLGFSSAMVTKERKLSGAHMPGGESRSR